MQALIDSHAFINQLSVRDVFRLAYIRAFDKDPPARSLDEDVAAYQKTGNVPPYTVRYMLEVYGAQ